MPKKYGPWLVTKSVLKYRNPWITVREEKVTKPGGKKGIFGIVKMVAGVSILPLDDKGFVYLTEAFHYAIGKKSIEVASGGIDKGEKPLVAAKRELKEELGIKAGEWIDLGTMDPFTTVVKSPAKLYLVRKLVFGPPEDTEIIKVFKIKINKAVEMVMKSKITHGQSCVLILKAWEFLKQKRV